MGFEKFWVYGGNVPDSKRPGLEENSHYSRFHPDYVKGICEMLVAGINEGEWEADLKSPSPGVYRITVAQKT